MRPDQPDGQGPDEPRPAGPVAAGDPPPPPVAKASSGAVPPTAPPAGEAADQVDQDLEALLADTQRERDEYLDLAKRAQADFENYRKRMGAEVQAAAGRGKAEVIREVVPVLDDLERAIQAAGLDPEGDSEDGLAHGVLLVFRSLRDSLGRNGVEAMDPKGEKFDPVVHEALSTVPAEGVEPGTVVEVLQKGYRLGEQLIRPARVVVSE
jgi:molecular chaperone GrpE